MKFVNQVKIRNWLRAKNIANIGTNFSLVRKKNSTNQSYGIISFETIRFGATENTDILTMEIYSTEMGGLSIPRTIIDNILDVFPGSNRVFDGFTAYNIVPTITSPDFSIQGQYKVMVMFEVRYLI